MCCVIRCSNKVYQWWNHEPQGRLFTARLNTQCHLVSLESRWKCLCLSFPPSATLILLFRLSPPLRLPKLCFFSPRLFCFSLFPLSSPLPSLAFFCSRLFCFLFVTSVYVYLSLLSPSLSLFPPQCVLADVKDSLRQVVRRGFTRLRETQDEKRSVRVTIHFNLSDMSCDILKVDMKRTRSVQFV